MDKKAGGTPCVAAHSTVRALFANYNGRLYQVRRASDNRALDIGVLSKGGFANAVAQDDFCAGTACTITIIYDQTPRHNDLTIEDKGGAGPQNSGVPADALPISAGGLQLYGASFSGHMGYRNNAPSGIASNGTPEGMYMVTSRTHVNSACCFDYGNTEKTNFDKGNGHMDAINFGTECWFRPCVGTGPWVQADMENGLFMSYAGSSRTLADRSRPQPFVVAMLKNNGWNHFAIRSGDAQQGTLRTDYSGPNPAIGGYTPMHQEGGIVLGTGGDNSNGSIGSFFEGAMTAGYPSDEVEKQVQDNIVGVAYGGPTGVYGSLTVGAEVSLQIMPAGKSRFLTHESAAGVAPVGTQIVVDRQVSATSPLADRVASTWIVRRGFADNKCFSFESKDRPGEFIRHFQFVLYTLPYDGKIGADATFCPAQALSKENAPRGATLTSLQPLNFRDRYIRMSHGEGFVGAPTAPRTGANPWDGGGDFARDATLAVTMPLAQ